MTNDFKLRIEQIADNTSSPYLGYSLDEFCEYTSDYELQKTIRMLRQMPKGKRILRVAYEKVLERSASRS